MNKNHIVATNGPFAGLATVAGVTFKDISSDENGRTGTETSIVFEGAYLPIKAQQNVVRRWGTFSMALKRIADSDRWSLTVVLPFDEQGREPANLSGVYELDVETAQPNIYSSPKLRSLLPDNLIAMVARVVNDFEAGEYSTTNPNSQKFDGGWAAAYKKISDSVGDALLKARALQLFSTVAAKKTDAFIEYYNVFRRCLTAALPGQVRASYEGVKGKFGEPLIWTSQEVMDWEDINPNGILQLDTDVQWIKSRPQVTAAAGQRTQVTYTYTEFKQANGLLYSPYGSALLLYDDPEDLPPDGNGN